MHEHKSGDPGVASQLIHSILEPDDESINLNKGHSQHFAPILTRLTELGLNRETAASLRERLQTTLQARGVPLVLTTADLWECVQCVDRAVKDGQITKQERAQLLTNLMYLAVVQVESSSIVESIPGIVGHALTLAEPPASVTKVVNSLPDRFVAYTQQALALIFLCRESFPKSNRLSRMFAREILVNYKGGDSQDIDAKRMIAFDEVKQKVINTLYQTFERMYQLAQWLATQPKYVELRAEDLSSIRHSLMDFCQAANYEWLVQNNSPLEKLVTTAFEELVEYTTITPEQAADRFLPPQSGT